ncbi:MAG: hypothetical protein KDA59_07730, partial [Planctomycetales bacterium]|nr:hypothetical protein [Planctomycetales bacterium]
GRLRCPTGSLRYSTGRLQRSTGRLHRSTGRLRRPVNCRLTISRQVVADYPDSRVSRSRRFAEPAMLTITLEWGAQEW